ncbi:MAG: hypothetical protein HUJ60_00075, partial [Bacilli bacterium]|nr:hypothetical protein [Bacilli bacterium]
STPEAEAAWALPSDANSYVPLEDSVGLFRGFADIVGKKRFGIDFDLTLSHVEEGKAATATSFEKPAIDESMRLSGDAHMALENNRIGEIGVDVDLIYLDQGEAGQQNQLSLRIDGEAESDRQIALKLNETMKVRTSKSSIDTLMGSISDIEVEIGSDGNDGLLGSLLTSLSGIADAVDVIRNGEIGIAIDEGHYEGLLGALRSMEAAANQITITLDLSVLSGLEGEIEIVLDGKKGHTLATLTFNGAKFSYFTIDGAVELIDYDLNPLPGEDDFPLFSQLPDIAQQISTFTATHELEASLRGYVFKRGTTAAGNAAGYVDSSRHEQGFDFAGTFDLDFEEGMGAGSILFYDRSADYIQQHNAKIDVTGTADNNGKMAFSYDSKNDTSSAFYNANKSVMEKPSNADPITGYMTIHSINDLIDVAMSLLQSEDTRLERITNLLSFGSASSVISLLLGGKYFEALTSPLVKSFSLLGDQLELVLPKEVLGLASDLVLDIEFGETDYSDDENNPIHHGLKRIEVAFSMGEEEISDVYLDIALSSLNPSSMHRNFTDAEIDAMLDYSSLSSMLDAVKGTFLMGEEIEDGSVFTTY